MPFRTLLLLSPLFMLRSLHARVAELVDAPDLGSGVLWTWGFDSPPGHILFCTKFCTLVLYDLSSFFCY